MSIQQEDRQKALAEILHLATTYNLTLDDIGAVLTKRAQEERGSGLAGRILGYVGAALIFGGLCLYIAMEWDMLPSAARVLITYGSGLIAFILGIAAVKDSRYKGASSAIFTMAALLLPTGMFVFLHEYSQGGDAKLASIVVFSILSLQFLAVFSKLKTTSLLFFAYGFFNIAVTTLLDYIGIDDSFIAIVMGVSILAVSWKLDATPHRAMVPFWYFIGGGALLGGAYDLLEGSVADVLLAALSAGLMFLSIQVRSRSLLTVGTLGFLGFLGYYTDEYFKDIVGWPIALIIAGFALVGISSWALRIGRTIKSGEQSV